MYACIYLFIYAHNGQATRYSWHFGELIRVYASPKTPEFKAWPQYVCSTCKSKFKIIGEKQIHLGNLMKSLYKWKGWSQNIKISLSWRYWVDEQLSQLKRTWQQKLHSKLHICCIITWNRIIEHCSVCVKKKWSWNFKEGNHNWLKKRLYCHSLSLFYFCEKSLESYFCLQINTKYWIQITLRFMKLLNFMQLFHSLG